MKLPKKSVLLPAIVLGGGAVGLALRLWQLRGGMDPEGLLVSGHPAGWLLSILCAAVGIALFVLTRNPGGPGKYYDNFPKSTVGGVCAFLAAVCLFFTVLGEMIGRPDILTMLCDLLGLLAVFSLAFTGYCRMQRRRPNFLFHTLVCLYFTLRLICRYRSWSSNPQIAEYAWELLATICLMLAAYHRAAFDLNMGSRRSLEFFGLAGVFFCILSLGGNDSKIFYLSAGAWLLTNLCVLEPLPGDPGKPETEPVPEPPAGDA